MSQESLDFGPVWRVKDCARQIWRLADLAVEAIGGVGVAAGACAAADLKIDATDLRRSIDREGRRLAVEHAMVIAAMCSRSNRELSVKLCSAFVEPLGLVVAPTRPRLTDDELRRKYEAGELVDVAPGRSQR